jgi:hypothetical protein
MGLLDWFKRAPKETEKATEAAGGYRHVRSRSRGGGRVEG